MCKCRRFGEGPVGLLWLALVDGGGFGCRVSRILIRIHLFLFYFFFLFRLSICLPPLVY
ncbi:uncharacterized protein BDW47DRAFT_104071 [Aspergillus candidus]|uniref:Uncharacterized protein n=1 Tax=Aspergillus candidus TaxID=41067 RepID=A0A2I2FEE9_ASPCN|nr:hypothetical protein BDW47DRAFT_104071 [Aspergillus candidus]PLB38997.1 hypothetical protein BDW47DRAFT_104071 [Aspergillus candidus]